jgi:hypothetical protein
MLRKSRYAALFLDERLTANTTVTVFLLVTRHVFICKMLLEFVVLAPSLLAVLGAFAVSFIAGAPYFTTAVISNSRSLCRTVGACGLSRSCGNG